MKYLFLLFIICSGFIIQKTDTQNFAYEPSLSVISGKVTVEPFFGPPGYGRNPKTDPKETATILYFEKPVNILSSQNSSMSKFGVKRIQLVSMDNIDLKRYKNKRVHVTGRLFIGYSAHHYTEVILNVSKIQAY